MNHVLVIGATGNVGRHLVSQLVRSGGVVCEAISTSYSMIRIYRQLGIRNNILPQ